MAKKDVKLPNSLSHLLGDYNSDSDNDDTTSSKKMDDKVNEFIDELQCGSKKSLHTFWTECIDKETGHAYYWNIETKEVTWDMPEEYDLYLKKTIANSKNINTDKYWKICYTDDKMPYYVNEYTRKVSWEQPIEFEKQQQQQPQQISDLVNVNDEKDKKLNSKSIADTRKSNLYKAKKKVQKKYPINDDDIDDEKIELISSFNPESESSSEDDENSTEKQQHNNYHKNHLNELKLVATEYNSDDDNNTIEKVNVSQTKRLFPAILSSNTTNVAEIVPIPKQLKIYSIKDDANDAIIMNTNTLQSSSNISTTTSITSATSTTTTASITITNNANDLILSHHLKQSEAQKTTSNATVTPNHLLPKVNTFASIITGGRDPNDKTIDEYNLLYEQADVDGKPATNIKNISLSDENHELDIDTKLFKRKRRIEFNTTSAASLSTLSKVSKLSFECYNNNNNNNNNDTNTDNDCNNNNNNNKNNNNLNNNNDSDNNDNINNNNNNDNSNNEDNDNDNDSENHNDDNSDNNDKGKNNNIIDNNSNSDYENNDDEMKQTNNSNDTDNMEFQNILHSNDDKESLQTDKLLKYSDKINVLKIDINGKLKFLCDGKSEISPVQIMQIQFQTLLDAYEHNALQPNYILNWLMHISNDLLALEKVAAPNGWKCLWNRKKSQYCYKNLESGQIKWEYPQIFNDLSEETTIKISPTAITTTTATTTTTTSSPTTESETTSKIIPSVNASTVNGEELMDICTTPPPPSMHEYELQLQQPQINTTSMDNPPEPPKWDHTISTNFFNEPLPPGIDPSEYELSMPPNETKSENLNVQLASFYSDLATLDSIPISSDSIEKDFTIPNANVMHLTTENNDSEQSQQYPTVNNEENLVKRKKKKAKKSEPWRTGNLENWINKWQKAQRELNG